jgi:hypothetical protein
MAVDFLFYAGSDFDLHDVTGSGQGYYGTNGFGFSVPVGQYQGRTFITDATGSFEGPECDNIKFVSATTAILGQAGTAIPLTEIPNYLASLKIRLVSDTPIRVYNTKVRIFDRTNIDVGPVGVTCKVAELIHLDNVQTDNGSGDTSWHTPDGSSDIVDLVASPGLSGISPSGEDTVDTVHDWFIAISASPDSIGSKTQFGLYVETEYL